MKKISQIIFLISIFCLAFVCRLYKVSNPIADWHSWRQADTASVTRNFIKQGFSPLFPKFDAMSSLNDFADKNPNRYFFAEFPLYNILVYPLYKHFGVNPVYHRLVSIFFSSLTTISIFFLAKFYSNINVAYFSSIIFALLPYNIYYGRVTMPDPLYVFFSVTGLYFISIWLKQKQFFIGLLASLFIALAILTKPYGLILSIPIGLTTLYYLFLNKKINWLHLVIIAAISVTPYLLWKNHIDHYPEGQFATTWLYNSTNIRFRPAFFRWLFYERFCNLILGGGGFVLLFLGFISPKTTKESIFYYSWLASLILFLFIIATGNVTHDYYQLPFVPIFSILSAKGIDYLLKIGKGFVEKTFNFSIAAFLVVMMFSMGWYNVKDFFNINNWPIVKAGIKADQILPSDALVIAPYNNDPAFLYQTNRYGWTNQVTNLDELKTKYSQPLYLVSVAKDSYTQEIMKNNEIIDENSEFVIVKIK